MVDNSAGRRYGAWAGKIGLVVLVGLGIYFFLQATVARVAAGIGEPGQMGGNAAAAGSPAIAVITLGFLILFLGGVCYAFWLLLVQHYIALSLTRDWVVGILQETEEDVSWRIEEQQPRHVAA